MSVRPIVFLQEVAYRLSIGIDIGDLELEQRNSSYFALFHRIRQLWRPIINLVEELIDLKCLQNIVFSERELKFTFAICHRPSVCRLFVVCRLSVVSVVCNVGAPYSGD